MKFHRGLPQFGHVSQDPESLLRIAPDLTCLKIPEDAKSIILERAGVNLEETKKFQSLGYQWKLSSVFLDYSDQQ